MIVVLWISAPVDNFRPINMSVGNVKYLYTSRWQYLIYLFIIYKTLGRSSAIDRIYYAERYRVKLSNVLHQLYEGGTQK
jgi:hypothetical protein